MSSSVSLSTLACTVASAVLLVGLVLLAPDSVSAQGAKPGTTQCSCPEPDTLPKKTTRPKFADARPTSLDRSAEVAVLEAVHLALTEVGDGSSYVWHRKDGHLSGVIQPTTSFKDQSGKICRHIVLTLSAANQTKRTEGIACRLATGVWQLEG